MSFFTALDVSASALSAERLRVDLATANLANARSTRTAEGGPYKRKDAVFRAVAVGESFSNRFDSAVRRVKVEGIVDGKGKPREIFNPTHPDADENGLVKMPNVDVTEELVNLMSAQRSFEANISVIQASREMAQRALRIGR